jgi:hypothetical protein
MGGIFYNAPHLDMTHHCVIVSIHVAALMSTTYLVLVYCFVKIEINTLIPEILPLYFIEMAKKCNV